MKVEENVFDIMFEPLAGSSITNIFRLLKQNRFIITPRYMPRFLYAMLISSIITPFRLQEHFKTNKKIQQTQIKKDPIFILGHWRSGTTYLHNVLSQDPQFGFCSTFHTTVPGAFITGEKQLKPIVAASIPSKRPMDNAALAPDLPQEEEYGIANISPYGYYNGWVFPKNMTTYNSYVPIGNQAPKRKHEWMQTYDFFIKKLTYLHKGKQLLLKNPAHTARLDVLPEMYPQAKFINIHRNPYDVFYSMQKFMRIILPKYCVQAPLSIEEMQDQILSMYKILYTTYIKQKETIPKESLIEIRYEDFIKDPQPYIERIYKTLEIDGYEQAKQHITQYIASQRSFKTSNYQMDETLKNRIYKELSFAFSYFNYSK